MIFNGTFHPVNRNMVRWPKVKVLVYSLVINPDSNSNLASNCTKMYNSCNSIITFNSFFYLPRSSILQLNPSLTFSYILSSDNSVKYESSKNENTIGGFNNCLLIFSYHLYKIHYTQKTLPIFCAFTFCFYCTWILT